MSTGPPKIPPNGGLPVISDQQYAVIGLPRDATNLVATASFQVRNVRHYIKNAGLAIRAFADKKGIDKVKFLDRHDSDLINAILLGLPEEEREAYSVNITATPYRNDPPALAKLRKLYERAHSHVRHIKFDVLRWAWPRVALPPNEPADGNGTTASEATANAKPATKPKGDKKSNGDADEDYDEDEEEAVKPKTKAKKSTAKADKDSEEVAEEKCEGEYEDDSDDGTSVGTALSSIMSGSTRPSSAGSTSSAGSKRLRRSSSVSSMEVDSDDDGDSVSLQNAKANLEKTAPKWILLDQQKKLKELYQLASPFVTLSAEWASRYGVGSLQPEDARTMSALADWLMHNIDDNGNLNTEDDLKQSSASDKAVSFEV